MPKEEIDDLVPSGAHPKYDVDIRSVIAFVNPLQQVEVVGPGQRHFECPLIGNLGEREIPEFKTKVLKQLPNAISVRIVKAGPLGNGIFALAIDDTYKP